MTCHIIRQQKELGYCTISFNLPVMGHGSPKFGEKSWWSRLIEWVGKSIWQVKKTNFLMCFASTYRCYMPAVRFSRHFNSMSSELMVGFLDERKLTTTWADFVHWIGGVGNSRRSTTDMPGSGKSIASKSSGTSISIGCKALERVTWNGYEAGFAAIFFEQQIMSRSQLKASCLSSRTKYYLLKVIHYYLLSMIYKKFHQSSWLAKKFPCHGSHWILVNWIFRQGGHGSQGVANWMKWYSIPSGDRLGYYWVQVWVKI